MVLPYIDMDLLWVYTWSPSGAPFPPPSPSHPSGSSQCSSPEYSLSCIEPGLAILFTYDNIHVSMPVNVLDVLDFSHSNRCVVVSHFFVSPEGAWCEVSFHMLINYLHIFFGERSVLIKCLLRSLVYFKTRFYFRNILALHILFG